MDVTQLVSYVEEKFPGFGVNKRNAVVRLLSEISRRDDCDSESILFDDLIKTKDFFQIKSFLLGLRYPSLSQEELATLPPLTELQFPESKHVDLSKGDRSPKQVFYESSVANSVL